MAKYPNVTTTQAGLDAIAEANAQKKALVFTKIILGAGEMPASISRLTGLVDKKLEIIITEFENAGGGVFTVRGALSNQTLNEGFYAREVGVVAKVGDTGREILFSYTNGGNYVDYIPDKTTVMDSYTFTVSTVVGNAERLEVQRVDGAFVTRIEFTNHNASKTAHSAAFGEHNKSTSAHKPILDAIKAITGTSAFNTAPSKSIVEIINLLGMGGIVAAKLDANAGFVKFANGFTIQWGKFSNISQGGYITLPIAFGKEGYVVTGNDINDNNSENQVLSFRDITRTGVKVYSQSVRDSVVKPTAYGQYIALGI